MSAFTGELGIKIYTAVAVRHGLMLYKDTGMKPNRNWTPTAMIAKAKEITRKTCIKPRGCNQAIKELNAWLEVNVPIAKERGEIS